VTLTIGVDVGGTKIAAGVVDEHGAIVGRARVNTPAKDSHAAVEAIIDLTHRLRADHEGVAGIGISAAGFVSRDRATVLFAPNIAWRDLPLQLQLDKAFSLPVVVENDANAAAWGEFAFGSAKDSHDMLLVAVGTGIGGGFVTEGELVRGAFGVAGEIGHLRVVPNGHPCGCGQHGCLEQYASGNALVRFARENASSGSRLLAEVDGERERINGRLVTRLAQEGDEVCISLLADLGRWLGEGIASLATVVDPGLVVVGGGVAEAGDLLMSPLRSAFDTTLPATHNRPHADIRIASLGNEAAIIGAAELVRRELESRHV
jgi:glucokinase